MGERRYRLLAAVFAIVGLLASEATRADDKAAPITPSSDPFEGVPPLWRMGDIPPRSGHGREAEKSLKEQRESEKAKRATMTPEERAAARRAKAMQLQEGQQERGRFGVDYDRAGHGTRAMDTRNPSADPKALPTKEDRQRALRDQEKKGPGQ